jgi:hypothetical protein
VYQIQIILDKVLLERLKGQFSVTQREDERVVDEGMPNRRNIRSRKQPWQKSSSTHGNGDQRLLVQAEQEIDTLGKGYRRDFFIWGSLEKGGGK